MSHTTRAKKVHDIKNALGVILLTVQVLPLEAERKNFKSTLASSGIKVESQVKIICDLLDSLSHTDGK